MRWTRMQKLAIISAAYAPVTSAPRKEIRISRRWVCASGCARYTRCIYPPRRSVLNAASVCPFIAKAISFPPIVRFLRLCQRFSFHLLSAFTRGNSRFLEIGTVYRSFQRSHRSILRHCVVSVFLFFFSFFFQIQRRNFRLNFSVSVTANDCTCLPLLSSFLYFCLCTESHFRITRRSRYFFTKFEENFRSNSEGNGYLMKFYNTAISIV